MPNRPAAPSVVLARTRWIVDREKFEKLRAARDLTKTSVAVSMGYGNGGQNPKSALEYLHAVLNGQPTTSRHILRACSILGAGDPFLFADPVVCSDRRTLREICVLTLNNAKLLRAARLLEVEARLVLNEAGFETDGGDEELYSDLLEVIRRKAVGPSDPERDKRLRRAGPSVGRELLKIEILRRCRDLALISVLQGGKAKNTIDLTGLVRGYANWDEFEYLSLLATDEIVARSNPCQPVRRTFGVDRSGLCTQQAKDFARVLRAHVDRGLEARIKYCDPNDLGRDYMSDTGMIGDWIISVAALEALTTDSCDLSIEDFFVHRDDGKRFKAALEKVDWTTEDRAVDFVVRRHEDIDDVLVDLRRA